MTIALTTRLAEDSDFAEATDALIDLARQVAPAIRSRARSAELLRRLPDETMTDVQPLLSALVPKRFGGQGLGSRALGEVARELAHGDASSAWTVAFLMEHSWMACHLPWDEQERLFAQRPYILAAAPLSPGGSAVRVDGGYRVSGAFRYATGVGNSEWTFATALIDDGGAAVPYRFLFPLEDVTVEDDWHMSGMAATGSATVTARDVFVPESRALPTAVFDSIDQHPGAGHEEPFMRYPPLGTIRAMMAGVCLGSAQACIDIARERLSTSKVWGTPRIEFALPRVRWGQALQDVRCAELLWRQAMARMIVKCDAVEPWSEEDAGLAELDMVKVVQLSQHAIGHLCDGAGSSTYQLDEPLQRYRRDVDVIASHLFLEPDYVTERATRGLLGLGYLPTDPPTSRPPQPSGRG